VRVRRTRILRAATAVDINIAVVYKVRACAYEPVCWRPSA